MKAYLRRFFHRDRLPRLIVIVIGIFTLSWLISLAIAVPDIASILVTMTTLLFAILTHFRVKPTDMGQSIGKVAKTFLRGTRLRNLFHFFNGVGDLFPPKFRDQQWEPAYSELVCDIQDLMGKRPSKLRRKWLYVVFLLRVLLLIFGSWRCYLLTQSGVLVKTIFKSIISK